MSLLDQYDYQLPPELIAHTPASPRDSARLFVYDTQRDTISFKTVADLPTLIPNTLLVYNDTLVLPARLQCTHEGESIELLILVDQGIRENGTVRALVNRRVRTGQTITAAEGNFVVLEDHEKSMLMRYNGNETGLLSLLEQSGAVPLPPYIISPDPEVVRRQQYQTMFAYSEPSVAAPTASLHFTPKLVEELENAGVALAPITLQVGLGTFAPIFEENFAEKKLHKEQYSICKQTAEAISRAKENNIPTVAVGTTCLRAMESAQEQLVNGEAARGSTDIFIFPPHQFTYPDILLTNFHIPKSSLLCLVQAFLEYKNSRRHIIDLYKTAIERKFRFYSFGDAMLIL